MPKGCAVTMRDRHRQLVEPRVWEGRRPESDREPVCRLRRDAEACESAVHESLALTPGDGDAGRGEGVPLDRLGLGRRVARVNEGLHALLHDRPLARLRTVRDLQATESALRSGAPNAVSSPGLMGTSVEQT